MSIKVKRQKGRFAADVLKLTSGTVLAQVVSVLAAPVLARLFSPQAFGIAALFTSITGVLSIVVCLRYDRSIIVPESDEEAINLVGVSLFFAVLITALSWVIVFAGRVELLRKLNAPALDPCLWLVPVNIFLLGLAAALNSWNTRKRHFVLITVAQVASSISYLGFAIVAGTTGHSTGGYLILGASLGQTISTLVLCIQTARECWPDLYAKVNRQRMVEALHRYHRFPKYSSGAAILNSIAWELPSFFLSGFFSAAVVGQYALGNRLIRIPMSFIGINVSRVFSQRAAEAKHEGTLTPLVEKTFQMLLHLGMFPFLLLTLIGRELFSLIFGARWAEAGVYTEILSFWAFLWFASAPLSSVLDILDEQAFDLRMNVLILASRFVSLLLGCYLGDPRTALMILSGSGVLVYGYYCVAILSKCGLPASRSMGMLSMDLLRFVPFGGIVLLARFLGAPSLVILALATVLLLVYYLSILRRKPELREILYSLLCKRLPRELAPEVSV